MTQKDKAYTSDDYKLTCQFSDFRNPYIAMAAEELFEFKWTLLSQDDSNDSSTRESFPFIFEDQSEDATVSIGFSASEVTPRGGYQIQLEVIDKANYMKPQSIMYDFRTDYCLSIFDTETKQAFVERDLDEVLGANDIYIYYEYEECSKTMGVYSF